MRILAQISKQVKKGEDILSPVTCHLSLVTCHLSPVTCHLSPSAVRVGHLRVYNHQTAVDVQIGLGHMTQPFSVRTLFMDVPQNWGPLGLTLISVSRTLEGQPYLCGLIFMISATLIKCRTQPCLTSCYLLCQLKIFGTEPRIWYVL